MHLLIRLAVSALNLLPYKLECKERGFEINKILTIFSRQFGQRSEAVKPSGSSRVIGGAVSSIGKTDGSNKF